MSESPYEKPAMNGWEASAGAWINSVDAGEANRVQLLDPVMLSWCEVTPGLKVLDVGCGEGRFCRILRQHGAVPVGIDPTEGLLQVARERDPAGEYHLAFAEQLPFPEAHFDLVVSYLTLIDIPDFRAAIREMVRVLRPGGNLVVANLTSFSTATYHLWRRDKNGRKMYWTLDDYMKERAEWVAWKGIRIVNWHRPESAYMKAFLGEGLILEKYDEPTPRPEDAARSSQLLDHERKPDFVTMRWRKAPESALNA